MLRQNKTITEALKFKKPKSNIYQGNIQKLVKPKSRNIDYQNEEYKSEEMRENKFNKSIPSIKTQKGIAQPNK